MSYHKCDSTSTWHNTLICRISEMVTSWITDSYRGLISAWQGIHVPGRLCKRYYEWKSKLLHDKRMQCNKQRSDMSVHKCWNTVYVGVLSLSFTLLYSSWQTRRFSWYKMAGWRVRNLIINYFIMKCLKYRSFLSFFF